MISLEDCLGFSEFTEEEVLAIAYVQYLAQTEHGTDDICRMIVDDIREAQRRDDCEHVKTLLHVLHAHPEARPAGHPWQRVFWFSPRGRVNDRRHTLREGILLFHVE